MKKIIFLDIDGVLNCSECFDRHRKEWEAAGKPSDHKWWNMLEPLHIEHLNRITGETGAEIVISSSWRGDPKTHTELIETGVTAKIIDDTGRCCSGMRGVEIKNWVDKNIPYKERDADQFRFVILDDDSDMLLWQKDNFFQTSFTNGGLTKEIADRVIAYLNGTSESVSTKS